MNVAIIAFNRPDLTRGLMEKLSNIRPKRLFAICDGPRPEKAGEAELVQEVQAILTNPPWNCELITNFSKTNLGCRRRVASGLTWAFQQSEDLIVLEDDCHPDPSFFPYCVELLDRYRNDPRVALISGSRQIPPSRSQVSSYSFTKYPFIWGWASWSRVWKDYDEHLGDWDSADQDWLFKALGQNSRMTVYWSKNFDRIKCGFNTWDYQLIYLLIRKGMFGVIPNQNLVENLGFGPSATHTQSWGRRYRPPVGQMDFPLKHPHEVKLSARIERALENEVFHPTFIYRIRRGLFGHPTHLP